MTATITDTDLSLDGLIDFEQVPVCEHDGCKDQHPPATHLAVFTCGCQRLYCQPCADRLIDFSAHNSDRCEYWECYMCGLVEYGIFRDLFRLVPL